MSATKVRSMNYLDLIIRLPWREWGAGATPP